MAGKKRPLSRGKIHVEKTSRPSTAAKRALTHDDILQASVRIDPDLRRRSELLWADRSEPTRGPKRGWTPDDVVQAAMQIADDNGLSAVTMSAVATRLGFTTMALYRYFPNKETLLDAIVDAGMGPAPKPTNPSGRWRARVTEWALAKRSMLCARPWLAELPFIAAPHGPNWLSWLEVVLEPLSTTGLSAADQGQMLSIVDGYTRGASDTAISLARAKARGASEAEWAAAVGADLGRAIGDARFPVFAGLLAAPPDGTSRTMNESFEFGLQRVLDGIEVYVTGRRADTLT